MSTAPPPPTPPASPLSTKTSAIRLRRYLTRLKNAREECTNLLGAQAAYDADVDGVRTRDVNVRVGEKIDEIVQEKVKVTHRLIADTVREAAGPGRLTEEDLKTLVDVAAVGESKLIGKTWGSQEDEFSTWKEMDILCGNQIKDNSIQTNACVAMGLGRFAEMIEKIKELQPEKLNEPLDLEGKLLGYTNTPYSKTPRPSPLSSELARFPPLLNPLADSATPEAVAFAEARCEIKTEQHIRPMNMRLDGNYLATLHIGGYKEAYSLLYVNDLSQPRDYANINQGQFAVRVPDHSRNRQLLLDAGRKLVWVMSSKSVQGFRFGLTSVQPPPSRRNRRDELDEEEAGYLPDEDPRFRYTYNLPVKDNFDSGVIGLADGGAKLLRAGFSGLERWNISALPARALGSNTNDTASYTHLKTDAFACAGAMHPHPSDLELRIVGYHDKTRMSAIYPSGMPFGLSIASLVTGQVASRYVGNSQAVEAIATSDADSHGFITSAGDGGIRYYDARLPAPVYCLEFANEPLHHILYESIGGHPFIIIGGSKSEQLKIWDARARKAQYELSTGNNSVAGLVWDAPRSTLVAGLDCTYRGRTGDRHGYRPADFGPQEVSAKDAGKSYMDKVFGGIVKAWPNHAFHDERSFGHPFDCSHHRIIRYAFKTEPDTTVLPNYGDAFPDGGMFAGW